MDPLKILAFAVYFFLALNISTIIVVQYAIPMKYAWAIYLGTMFIATLPCVYLVQGTTVIDLAISLGAAITGVFTFPVAVAGAAAGTTIAAGAAATETAAVFTAGAGALAATGGLGLAVTVPLLPRSRANSLDNEADGNSFYFDPPPPGSTRKTAWEELHGAGRRKRGGKGRQRRGGGLFVIPFY